MIAAAPITFDRVSGRLEGAGMVERAAMIALQAGAKISGLFEHRGFSIGCKAVRSMLVERDVIVRLNGDAAFAFPFGDGYWSMLLDRNFVYEPELEQFLKGVAEVDYTFVDCGANFGMWSVLVSSRPFGGHAAIAVEASPANFARLERNARLNGGRFKVLNRAIGGTTGGTARISGKKHEALSIVPDGGPGRGEEVAIIALDSLLDEGLVAPSRRLVVKLDVEGMEIEAIKGGRRMGQADTVIVCEEHGSDREHTVSRFIMNETPYRVFVLDPETGGFERLVDLATLDRIKVASSIGYNVFATTSPFWEERLKSTKSPARH